MRVRQSFPILHDNLTLHWYAECTWLFILKVHLRITYKPPTAKDSNTDLCRCRLTQSSVVLHVHGLLFSSSVLPFLFNFLYPLFILIPNFTPRSLSFFSLLFSHFKLDRRYWCIVWFYLRLSFINVKWCIKYKSDSSTKRIKRYTLYTLVQKTSVKACNRLNATVGGRKRTQDLGSTYWFYEILTILQFWLLHIQA